MEDRGWRIEDGIVAFDHRYLLSSILYPRFL